MRVGLLQTGRSPDAIRPAHGDYDALFRQLLAGRGFEFRTYAALDGALPRTLDEADAWLITGSKFGAYEDHPWIPPLEDFLRRAYSADMPIAGICFGHQILAQALGGKVEKFAGGWSVGTAEYVIEGTPRRLLAWHQDQVTRLPDAATVIGASDFCAHAVLSYGPRVFTLQPHPEFTPAFMADLLVARGEVLPPEVAAAVDPASFAQADARAITDRIAQVLQGGAIPAEHPAD